jgi:hypothetical protein
VCTARRCIRRTAGWEAVVPAVLLVILLEVEARSGVDEFAAETATSPREEDVGRAGCADRGAQCVLVPVDGTLFDVHADVWVVRLKVGDDLLDRRVCGFSGLGELPPGDLGLAAPTSAAGGTAGESREKYGAGGDRH